MELEIQAQIEPYANKLAAFETADRIAEFLADEGIRGSLRCATNCAIGRYINAATGLGVLVSGVGIFADWADYNAFCDNPTSGLGIEVTPAMVQFINQFDSGQYPELVAK